jgi:hypothetical protein
MTIADLQEEHSTELIGDRIYTRVQGLVEAMLRKRDPAIYARGAHDYRDALADVAQDFVMDVLIGERQVDYVMSVATDLGSFDRLVNRQIRRYLARTRVRTVIDNLMERSVQILQGPPFVSHRAAGEDHFRLAAVTGQGPVQPERLRRAVALAQGIPKSTSSGDERAPRIYDEDALRAVLTVFCEQVLCPISRKDVQDFLQDLLTPWTPSFLEEEGKQHPEQRLTPEEETIVAELAEAIVGEMSGEDHVIFQYKFANLADREIASALGLSRQSTAPRKKALFARISESVSDLAPHIQHAVLARTNFIIATRGIDVNDS